MSIINNNFPNCNEKNYNIALSACISRKVAQPLKISNRIYGLFNIHRKSTGCPSLGWPVSTMPENRTYGNASPTHEHNFLPKSTIKAAIGITLKKLSVLTNFILKSNV